MSIYDEWHRDQSLGAKLAARAEKRKALEAAVVTAAMVHCTERRTPGDHSFVKLVDACEALRDFDKEV